MKRGPGARPRGEGRPKLLPQILVIRRPIGGFAPKRSSRNFVDFCIVFWSFWGRFWVRFGGRFRSFWRFGRPKLVPEPPSNRYIFEKYHIGSCKMVNHANVRLAAGKPRFARIRGGRHEVKKRQNGAKMGPRSLQDSSKIVLDRLFLLFRFRFVFLSFSAPFRCRLGCQNGAQN